MVLTQKIVCDALDYDPETGRLTWKITTKGAREGRRAGWFDDSHGYRGIMVLGNRHSEHRLIWFLVHGIWPTEIDHINGVGTDNRWCNLRETSQRQNMQNMGIHRNGKLVGAIRRNDVKRTKPWAARYKSNGKAVLLGDFETEVEAHNAYVKAMEALGVECV